jgi:hypothetical protein
MSIYDQQREILNMRHSDSLKNRFTRVQNHILDNMPRNLSASDRAVIDCVVRNSNGYNYATCKLSFSEISKITEYETRTIQSSVKKLRAIGILCVLEKTSVTSKNEYYIDPYWNTDQSIKKQLEALETLEEKHESDPISGPCLLESTNDEIDIESDVEENCTQAESKESLAIPDLQNNPEKIEQTNNENDVYSDRSENSTPTENDHADHQNDDEKIEETKEFVESLVSSITENPTTQVSSDLSNVSALKGQGPGTGFKIQTYTQEQIKNVCKKFSQTFPDDRLDDYDADDYKFISGLIRKYGYDMCISELNLLAEYRKHTKILNARGIFTSSLANNYIAPLRLRQKLESDKYWQRKADESRQRSVAMLKTREEIEKRRSDTEKAISNLTELQLAEIRKIAYEQLIAEGQPPAFVQFALDARVNELICKA